MAKKRKIPKMSAEDIARYTENIRRARERIAEREAIEARFPDQKQTR